MIAFQDILYLPFLGGAIFIVAAMVVSIFPPKKINHLYGYRTTASMKSQERWDFAQKYSTMKMFQAGAVLFAISFLGLIVPVPEKFNLVIGIFLMLASCAFMLITTENALRKNFND